MVFVYSYYGGRKRNAVKQELGRFGNMEMRDYTLSGKSVLKNDVCLLVENSFVTVFVSCKY